MSRREHLDGRGQLPHLDMILAMEGINGVQWVPGDGTPGFGAEWVPGDGTPGLDRWMDVYRRIFAAGKKTQVWGPAEPVRRIIREAGLGTGIHYRMSGGHVAEEKLFRQKLSSLGLDA